MVSREGGTGSGGGGMGGGMSRAAQKRAKKKQQQQKQQQSKCKSTNDGNDKKRSFEEEEENETLQNNTHNMVITKKEEKKKKKKSKKEKKKKRNEEDHENDNDNDNEGMSSNKKSKTKKKNKRRISFSEEDNEIAFSHISKEDKKSTTYYNAEDYEDFRNEYYREEEAKYEEELLLQQHNPSTTENGDNDNDVVMKATPVTMKSRKEMIEKMVQNKKGVNLKDILLLDNDDVTSTGGDGDDDNATNNDFHQLTSKERATCAIQFLTGMSSETFYSKYWGKEPLCVQQKQQQQQPQKKKNGTSKKQDSTTKKQEHQHRLDGFLSLRQIQTLTKRQSMFYGRDLNITKYGLFPSRNSSGTKNTSDAKRRITLDVPGDEPADPDYIWSNFFNDGCTVRLLCPHKHNPAIHTLLSLLELEWGCMVGANAYLTPGAPPSSKTKKKHKSTNGCQGFAPHYDDIDAFILQLEGKKRWKVYAPLCAEERLPRASSEDYTDKQIPPIDESTGKIIEPVLDMVLEAGDVLYMPRGYIHQAYTLVDEDDESGNETPHHSLHLTVSTMQQWCWLDLLDILLPEALAKAGTGPNTVLRSGLPRCFLDYMGAIHHQLNDEELPDALRMQIQKSKKEDEEDELAAAQQRKRKEDEEEDDDDDDDNDAMEPQQQYAAATAAADANMEEDLLLQKEKLREAFRTQAKKQILRVAKGAMEMVDSACDEMGKRFMSERLPPAFTVEEKLLVGSNNNEKEEIWPHTYCRLARPGIARLVIGSADEDDEENTNESNMAVLYHCADNSKVYQEIPISPMEFELDDAPAIEQILTTVEPNWIQVKDLIHDDIKDKIAIVRCLHDEGILAVTTPAI